MSNIPDRHDEAISLHHLRILDVIVAERSLTAAARILDTTQPHISKVLARLREHFRDPLFVRAGGAMEPTAKALELLAPIRQILTASLSLRAEPAPFTPATSERSFCFFISDVGAVRLSPPLMARLQREAPHVKLRIAQLDARQLLPKLESGEVDVAIGAFPDLVQGIRRRKLFTEAYVAIVRAGHPALVRKLSAAEFLQARHVIVSATAMGHAHREAEAILERTIPPDNVALRVPSFVAAAMVVKRTDAIAILPANLASFIAPELGLAVFRPPLALPTIEIAQYWHERFHRDTASRWIRAVLIDILGQRLRNRAGGNT